MFAWSEGYARAVAWLAVNDPGTLDRLRHLQELVRVGYYADDTSPFTSAERRRLAGYKGAFLRGWYSDGASVK